MSASLILASTSPQRASLLKGLGLSFDIVPSTVDEDIHPEREPAKRSQTLARLKAENVAYDHAGSFVLGADTLVVSKNGTLLEKPADADEARHMLRLQSGGESIVYSAVCLIDPNGQLHEGLDSSSVFFKTLTDEDIEWWIGTHLWAGRSGAFQIDGPGQLMIERIEGDWSGIVGLPVYLFGKLAREAGFVL
ncbi:Maf family protein [Candidatus Peribacteria bacterium]|nr:MAG: Maf family protein [Candidatus Peribacteria bacterium]